ncbi:cytochrome P450 [Candidatus Mycobacterium wuenschmannii]|uniref:Cytochrome P450 n=1 Tax=Candidatus Mycobacterium wuenschmannii TaxID=3027808 RepID=A0ABY8VUN3_9MYCO|nr:cytochrome P450 [Candidatus Mycobacterium wuenschmannii]WIM86756.1 cytochrome P450 [Candidatus Mycobacterium wuenschmannii]
MSDFESVDYFTDQSLVPDPYPYYDYLRSSCPVRPATPHGVVAVTGHAVALAAYKDPAFSSCVAVAGPFPPLPFTPAGDDISDLIAEHRAAIPMAEHVVTMDAEDHAKTRGLLSKLITPKRLSENEEFMWRLVDEQIDKFLAKGSCEFMEDFAKPLSMLVIADLLGVPVEDHKEFRAVLGNEHVGELGKDDTVAHNPLMWLDDRFRSYITDRRRAPREDVLTELAAATYPDGSIPDVEEVVKLATFLFAAGMETTTKLLGTGMRVMSERPEIQQKVRDDRSLIPAFLEESLRMESPVKSHFRLARTNTRVGDVDIAAGTIIMLLPGASNRDPEKFECPHEFRHDRRNVREHVAFGRGPHSCPGAPLARAEARIAVNRLLDRAANFRISESHHGTPEDRSYTYDPTFIMRGLSALNIEFDPIS